MKMINEVTQALYPPQRIEVVNQLTKREQFAMAALQGFAGQYAVYAYSSNELNKIAKAAVLTADALIKELEK
jgi:superfamily II helicase